jgi:hypothetical protein
MLRFVGLAALGLLSCGCSYRAPGSAGELDKGVFVYGCSGSGDPACRTSTAFDAWKIPFGNEYLPRAVAIGAPFGVTYVRDWNPFKNDAGLPTSFTVRPASSEPFNTGSFVADQPGAYGLLARSASGITADFTHVEAVAPHDLEIWAEGKKITDLAVYLGQHIHVGVLALGPDGAALGGASNWSWSVDHPGALLQNHSSGQAAATAKGDDEIIVAYASSGKATLTVTNGTLTKKIDLFLGGTP